eukprot:1566353-Amphidinium_carterae.1
MCRDKHFTACARSERSHDRYATLITPDLYLVVSAGSKLASDVPLCISCMPTLSDGQSNAFTKFTLAPSSP